MSRIKVLFFVLAVAAPALPASATVTYAVGSCKPTLASFSSISAALEATPAPSVVEVCPGNYSEQIVITKPVTIEGVFPDNATNVVITPPPGGLVQNASDDLGDLLAVQVWVDNASGEVNLSDLVIEGNDNLVSSGAAIVGVFYQNSSGTMNHLLLANQMGNGHGVGAWMEGGSSKPSVTVENSGVINFDHIGILAETNSTTSELKATINGNRVDAVNSEDAGIASGAGTTATVSGNLITGVFQTTGIFANSAGSVTKNTIVGAQSSTGLTATGIDVEADGVSVTSNMIDSASVGIFANSSVAPVTGNTITESLTGIQYNCVAGGNVRSNTIGANTLTGIVNVPSGAITINTYYGLDSIRGGGC